ncbi:helix-turn-helix domain-containing protein [Lacticaseibacillus jixianensis]|uniref:Helix-turn-helix domain-containing protein n=1 Tax=Lacticaseibacillus jixianensis TaxID=2486012 RepID=A0ABW4B8Z5_9LACO|nr:helix-turn-helix transcriptional regulator [Lacticaseibacillus jixianensis]
MTTWKDYKKTITAISPSEMSVIDTLAYLHSERIRQGISQRTLTTRIGMKQPQIARIEKLDSSPSLETLQRYASGLGLKVSLTVSA